MNFNLHYSGGKYNFARAGFGKGFSLNIPYRSDQKIKIEVKINQKRKAIVLKNIIYIEK